MPTNPLDPSQPLGMDPTGDPQTLAPGQGGNGLSTGAEPINFQSPTQSPFMDPTHEDGGPLIASTPTAISLTTMRGRVRFYMRDYNPLALINTDQENDFLLEDIGYLGTGADTYSRHSLSFVLLAASWGLSQWATDAAKLAEITKTGIFSNNTDVTYKALVERSRSLLQQATTAMEFGGELAGDVSCEFLPETGYYDRYGPRWPQHESAHPHEPIRPLTRW